MSATLNNFTNYSFIFKTSNQIIFDFKTRETLNFLRLKDFKQAAKDSERVKQANHVAKIFLIITRASNRLRQTSFFDAAL